MSWNFEFVAENKAAAKAQVEAQTMSSGIPESLALVIAASIDEQADDLAISVKSNGHLHGAYEHIATFVVTGVTLVRAAVTPGLE